VSWRPDRPAPVVRLVPGGVPDAATFGAGHPSRLPRGHVRTILVTSGRDGVGKSNLAANLALALGERGARVVLVDGDLAQANLDLLLGVHPRFDLGHVLAGTKTVDEVAVRAARGVTLVPAAASAPELAELDDVRRELLIRSLAVADDAADLMLVDTGRGASRQTLELCRAAHELIVVATPEMATFTEAYGLVKSLHREGALSRPPRLVVNLTTTPEEAEDVTRRMQLFARHFLRLEVESLGTVPWDAAVPRAVRAHEPVLLAWPDSPAAVAYRALAARLWKPVPSGPGADVASEPSHRLEA